MQLENHLIYIDITQICGIGCEFCMYSDKHTTKDHLVLTDKAKKNISKLINDKETSKVAISGEGEPLNNIKALKGEIVAPVSRRMTARIRVTKAAEPATSANMAP